MAQDTATAITRQPCFATGDGIICAGLPRSGTASLTAALEILGFGPVHHVLRIQDKREWYEWGRVAWCHFPYLRNRYSSLPFYMSRYDSLLPWTRANWDRLLGRYRVATDIASLFSKQLFDAYPEARVILVERPVEKWANSAGSVFLDNCYFGWRGFLQSDLGPWFGEPAPGILRDVLLGNLQADTRAGAWERLPTVHKEHYAMVRKTVPKEQLLEFNLADGWEPLCKFLGVPIPDVPFPHHNDRESIMQHVKRRVDRLAIKLGIRLGLGFLFLGLVGYGIGHVSRFSLYWQK